MATLTLSQNIKASLVEKMIFRNLKEFKFIKFSTAVPK